MVYRFVDMLNQNGFDAYALHQKINFRYTWFKNETRVGYTRRRLRRETNTYKRLIKEQIDFHLKLLSSPLYCLFSRRQAEEKILSIKIDMRSTDILVIPETRGSFLDKLAPGIRKIILNQNPYFTFSTYTSNRFGRGSPFHLKEILGMIVLSELNFTFQRHVFQQMNIYKVPLFIDSSKFYYNDVKKPQIAYMPRRCSKDSLAVVNMLKFRGLLQDFKIIAIDNKTEDEVANILRESIIFLSFSHREGFGLPAAEAMACGCIVIGYSGNGGDEFFKEDFSYKIREGDFIAYTATVEAMIERYYQDKNGLLRIGQMASEFILNTYSKRTTEKELVNTFHRILDAL
ncbi:glycosyltransferase [Desulfococcaceae bacterium HSG7]|nr:glycosyltransferase [Desulfococcaceae bacterium HSG7]